MGAFMARSGSYFPQLSPRTPFAFRNRASQFAAQSGCSLQGQGLHNAIQTRWNPDKVLA
jgi:hypothetical protein